MIRVVHITAHMSGGLARVLLSTLKHSISPSSEASHEIVFLAEVAPDVLRLFAGFEDKLHIGKSSSFIAAKVAEADVVQIEYWNHPLIYKFLFQFTFPAARILSCCHVSGFFRPQLIVERAVRFPDIFLAATKATGKHELFARASSGSLKEKLRFVRFPIDTERLRVKRNPDRNRFNVGYIGTVSYAKLHRGFLRMCAAAKIEGVRFIVCGQDSPDGIEEESKGFRSELFDFRGFQEDISRVLEKIDVFGYPLNSTHFGSGEQAMIEAMYFGIPIVAFSNAAEAEIVEHGVTGLLVDSEEEYTRALEYLHRNPEERARLGSGAKRFVETRLNAKECFAGLDRIYIEMMSKPKTVKTFGALPAGGGSLEGETGPCFGSRLMLEALKGKSSEFAESMDGRDALVANEADDRIARVELAMKTRTKGSLNQYLYFFPSDPYLNFWAGLIAQAEGRHEDAVRLFRTSLECVHPIERVTERLKVSLAHLPAGAPQIV